MSYIEKIKNRIDKFGLFSTIKFITKLIIKKIKFALIITNYRIKQNLILDMGGGRKTKPGKLYIVAAVDTEGPSLTDKNKSWDDIDLEISNLMSPSFRNTFKDSFNSPLIISWFIIDWVDLKNNSRNLQLGYHKNRNLQLGYHKIFDYYKKIFLNKNIWGDEVYWHYHHLRSNVIWNKPVDWNKNKLYEDILNRKIIDRNFFPPCFRAGATFENNDVSRWLEKWVPFDFSNNSPFLDSSGDIFDWSKAPTDWGVYHPSLKNYQKTGRMKRTIVRCINTEIKKCFTQKEVEKAFLRANNGKDTILSFFSHDNKNLQHYFVYALSLVKKISKKFPDVKYEFVSAKNAMQKVLKISEIKELKLKVSVKKQFLFVTSNHQIFGEQPYLVLKDTKNNIYCHDKLHKIGKNKWEYRLKKFKNQIIGVAASDKAGNTSVVLLKQRGND